MSTLAKQALQACGTSSNPLSSEQINSYLQQLSGWHSSTENNIQMIIKEFKFKNFVSAMAFTHHIAELAEAENHHPRICIEWGKVTVTWWTHTLNGLFINDFIMASRCDKSKME
jgi:4a-hydroxytetrahydrobiopterin dehydratase